MMTSQDQWQIGRRFYGSTEPQIAAFYDARFSVSEFLGASFFNDSAVILFRIPQRLIDAGLGTGLTTDLLRHALAEWMRERLWNHPVKAEAFHGKHSGEYNAEALVIGEAMIQRALDQRLASGEFSAIELREQDLGLHGARQFRDTPPHGIVARVIAGAEWMLSQTATDLIAKAETLDRGTQDQIKAQLRNRIIANPDPVAPDANLDAWPPLIDIRQRTPAEFYSQSPSFVHESEQEPATSRHIAWAVRDEDLMQLAIQTDDSAQGFVPETERSGGHWIADGENFAVKATDGAGNERIVSFVNQDGDVTASERVNGGELTILYLITPSEDEGHDRQEGGQ